MHVAGRDDGFAELFAELDDFFVYCANVVLAVYAGDIVVVDKELVVCDGLNLEIIVVIRYLTNLLLAAHLEESAV